MAVKVGTVVLENTKTPALELFGLSVDSNLIKDFDFDFDFDSFV